MNKTQADAVVEVMEQNGGYADFGHLYQHVLKVPGVKWTTKTPFASMRRIVQLDPRIFRVKSGLWALEAYKNKLPFPLEEKTKADAIKQETFSHTHFQGLALEIGNFKHFSTYAPPQDKNQSFRNAPLTSVMTVGKLYEFAYPELLKFAKTVDVIWFNQRNMPHTFIEVEHSTDIHNSLRKFNELQDFYAEFVIVAPDARKAEFETKRTSTSFRDIGQRVKFWGYEYVSKAHANLAEAAVLEAMVR
jgi:hypothetical protein